MKTITTKKYPSLIYSTEESAEEDAKKLGISTCRIIYISEWNGEINERFIGYGLCENNQLLGTKDLIWI